MTEPKKEAYSTPHSISPYLNRVKAIEIISDRLKLFAPDFDPDFVNAIKLALSALRDHERVRRYLAKQSKT